jgi:hypothetical protein
MGKKMEYLSHAIALLLQGGNGGDAQGTDRTSTSPYGTALRQVHTLVSAGAVGESTDEELPEMFGLRCGEAAELAFAAPVEPHGPMVHLVCRQVRGNPDDADDAFEATSRVWDHIDIRAIGDEGAVAVPGRRKAAK